MTVQRGKLAGVDWNWQWADEQQLALVIPGGAGTMAKVLADYERHGGQWVRAFNLPYFHDVNGQRLNIGHTRAGSYTAPSATPMGPRPRLYSVGGRVQISPSPTPRPEADWECETGPLLVIDGKVTNIATQIRDGRYTGLDPDARKWRCGLGWRDGRVVHIISAGAVATLHQLQAAALELGCEWFVAGDGGGSVTLYQRGETPVSRANDTRPLPAIMVFRSVESAAPMPPAQPPAGERPPVTAPILRQGDRSEHVRQLQELLIRAGYLEPGATDYFGPLTYAAVQAFQRAHGLVVDGIVGPQTWAALQAAPEASPVYADVQRWLVEQVIPGARALEAKAGVPWVFSAAQADLESWTSRGPSALARECNNLFGVKYRGRGQYREYQTWEHIDGKDITVIAKFQVYDSIEECFLDRAELLTNSRYAPALEWRDNWAAYAAAIHRAGYATDPWYTYKLIQRAYAHGIPSLG